jgi:hypothetical protein
MRSRQRPEDYSDDELQRAVEDTMALIDEHDVHGASTSKWPPGLAAWWGALMSECMRRGGGFNAPWLR